MVSPSLSDPLYHVCGLSSKYTANSTYESNLLALLPSLVYNGYDQGFYKDTVGRVPDQIHALSLCRGDINASVCRSCLDLARQDALQHCPYNKAAMIYYDSCLLRYSNQNFLNSTDNSDLFLMLKIDDVTDPDNFIKLPSDLVNRTFQYAAFNSSQRFGTGEGREVGELLEADAILGMSCTTPPTQQGIMVIPHRRRYPQWDQEMETRITLRRRRLAKKNPDDTNPEEITSVESILFDLSTLRTATENFSEDKVALVQFTSGYMAPEYAMRGQFSAKSDIFNFGVLVLEILTGRKNSNFLETEQAEDPAKLCKYE
ncbi:hypothetical protein J5N97_011548 [Dioscorea zingiberensis]|uniref:Gnk2-homologous domain-containing protein n=1 Tax=Dioscorea zingiberensis TaxID=325984 RepID=A0A9D5D1C4_9LILI|nr:hypothetical protein J5N97_011548 [Dioscorea zingiberensis]